MVNGFEIDPCSVCNEEDGLYFCRLCAARYCAEHLCLHLNVAWESNTWTSRNEPRDEINNNSHNPVDFAFGCNASSDNSPVQENLEPDAENKTIQAKSLLSFTEEQLEAQLRFYQSQSKRIRNELERRAFVLCPELTVRRTSGANSKWQVTTTRKATSSSRAKITTKQRAAIEWLSAQVKAGVFTPEQLSAILQTQQEQANAN